MACNVMMSCCSDILTSRVPDREGCVAGEAMCLPGSSRVERAFLWQPIGQFCQSGGLEKPHTSPVAARVAQLSSAANWAILREPCSGETKCFLGSVSWGGARLSLAPAQASSWALWGGAEGNRRPLGKWYPFFLPLLQYPRHATARTLSLIPNNLPSLLCSCYLATVKRQESQSQFSIILPSLP